MDTEYDERITAAYEARKEARKALKRGADNLRAKVLVSEYTTPQLAEVLGKSVSTARQLIYAAKNGRLPRTDAWAKKPKKGTAKGAKPFSGLVTVGYVDQDGNATQIAA